METFTLSQEVISKLTSNNNHTPTLLFSPTSGSKTASNVSYTKGMRHLSTCAICIDDFVAGVKVRKLPCTHFFHTECIDPWLQKQSALCPVCKYDTRMLMSVDDYECEDFNAAPLLEDGGIEKEVGMRYYLNRLYTTALGKFGGKNKKNKNTIPVRRVSFERPKFATHHRTIRVEKPTDNI
ncbi:Receptor-like protein [Zancudomyces culisetae]|uniref:Receptor-like protein n=1 Tax=Zancudomyces culisetae TaxID=1213189 RepID=A0A1R1PTE9_ZANCU|nr:Receptor-like protein [Zancudomyces culisetae]|eukprot:OMH84231.1 Receptor-like protein [Zancudomyces culisetae]